MLIGIAVIAETQGLAAWDDFGPGPRFFPLVGAVLMLVFGVSTAVSTGAVSNLERDVWARIGRYGGLLILCVLLLKIAGAFVAFALFFVFELRWVERYGWMRSVLLAITTVSLIYTGFVAGLQVRLPPMPLLQ